MTAKPLFIVFEGLDGSGTSTQAQLLVDFLSTTNTMKAKLTSEPSGGPIGQLIRSAMSGRLKFTDDKSTFDRQMAYLFAADRQDHLFNDTDGIVSLLKRGYSVVSTRYYFSSFAYHCESETDYALIAALNSPFPKPDMTIYLDVTLEVSMHRLQKRSNLDAYENHEKLRSVKQNYDHFFKTYDGALTIVSGSLSESNVHKAVTDSVKRLIDAR